MNDLIFKTMEVCGRLRTVRLIDDLKNIGFKGFTLSGLSLGMEDCGYLKEKDSIIIETNKKIAEIEDNYKMD